MQDQLGLRIRIRDFFQTCFDVTNPIMVLDLANELPLKIMFFKVNLIVSICVTYQELDIRGSVLETEHIFRLVLTIKIYF